MQREDSITSTIEYTSDKRLMIWQGVSAALAVLWIFTFAFMYFGSQLTTWQSLGVLKGELVSAMQTLAQQQQTFNQRLQTLEQAKPKE
jgi:hypothetical protein